MIAVFYDTAKGMQSGIIFGMLVPTVMSQHCKKMLKMLAILIIFKRFCMEACVQIHIHFIKKLKIVLRTQQARSIVSMKNCKPEKQKA